MSSFFNTSSYNFVYQVIDDALMECDHLSTEDQFKVIYNLLNQEKFAQDYRKKLSQKDSFSMSTTMAVIDEIVPFAGLGIISSPFAYIAVSNGLAEPASIAVAYVTLLGVNLYKGTTKAAKESTVIHSDINNYIENYFINRENKKCLTEIFDADFLSEYYECKKNNTTFNLNAEDLEDSYRHMH